MSTQTAERPTLTTAALAEAARRRQLALRREVVAATAVTWRTLDFDRLTQTWPGWLRDMTDVLTRMHATSADEGALFYRALRQHETGDPGTAVIANPPSSEWTARALGYAAVATYNRLTSTGNAPEVANRHALTKTVGTSARILLDGGRSTIRASVLADDKARGWYRITDGAPCAFCALVASKGVAYKSRDTAGADANDDFTGSGLFKFHNDCGCSVAPSFTGTVALTGPAQDANDLYFGGIDKLPNKERMTAFRKAWASRTT